MYEKVFNVTPTKRVRKKFRNNEVKSIKICPKKNLTKIRWCIIIKAHCVFQSI